MSRTISELFDLRGRTALVTGGSRGLGLQAAEALAESGARVCLTSRKEADLEAATAMLTERGLAAEWIAADASDVDQIQRMASAAIERMGTIDILVNNAGATWGAPAEDYPISAWDKVMNLNVRSAFVLSQYVAKHCMIARRRGRILMTASAAGFGGNPPGMETVAYNTSKAALINLTRALAGEWGEYGITVNALAPGFFPTKMTRGTLESVDLQGFISKVPLRRIGDDEDLKGSVVLLASDAGKHITGETIAIDGGFLAIRA